MAVLRSTFMRSKNENDSSSKSIKSRGRIKTTSPLINGLFVSFFATTTFLEIFFGFPSFIFMIVPFLFSSFFSANFRELTSVIILGLIYIFVTIGFIGFILEIVTPKEEGYTYSVKLIKFISYEHMNLLAVILIVAWYVQCLLSEDDLFSPIAETLYKMEMDTYQDFNPNCPQFSPNRTRHSNEIFIDEIHQKYLCCGWNDPTDWANYLGSRVKIPYSCCPPLKMAHLVDCVRDDPCSLDEDYYYKRSCKLPIMDTFRKFDVTNYSIGVYYLLFKFIALLCSRNYLKTHRAKSNIKNERS